MTLSFDSQRGLPGQSFRYSASGDVLTVTWANGEQEVTDTFDFTGLPDGELDVEGIESSLPVQPVLAAERVDGQLWVRVLHWYKRNEPTEREAETHG